MNLIVHRFPGPKARCLRRGFTLVECTVALLIVGVASALAFQMLIQISQARQAMQRQQTALAEAANALERVTQLGYDALIPDRLAAESLSPAAQHLDEGRLSVEAFGDKDGGQRLLARVTWRDRFGVERSVALTTWVYPDKPEARPDD